MRLKWPNDLAIEADAPGEAGGGREGGPPRKLGGVLGEVDGLGTDDPRVVVGIGINAGWSGATSRRSSRPP